MSDTAWNPQKVAIFREQYEEFRHYVQINSKDLGGGAVLGDHTYLSQKMLLDGIFDALSNDIHDIKVLKSRQLGVTTESRALSLFWNGVHDGLQGAMVYDTDSNKANARRDLEMVINSLPPKLRFPKVVVNNRDGIILSNKSKIAFMAAGTRSSRSGGGLGRSFGLNFGHQTEMCLAPDTPVLCADGREKRIADVVVGDTVITHSGATAEVTAIWPKKNNKKPMVSIFPWKGQPIICTYDHKIVTQRGLVKAGELKSTDRLIMPVRKITKQHSTSRLPPPKPKGGNLGSHSEGFGKEFALNEEFGFAMGYYLAEGCMTYQRRGADYYNNPAGIIFARHRDEKKYADRAIRALKPLTTGYRRTKDSSSSLTTTEHIYGAALAEWVNNNFGANVDKFIPDDVFSWGEDFCRGLISGLLCGDGSKTNGKADGKETNFVSLTSIRSSLVYQARDLVAALCGGWGGMQFRPAGQWYGRNCKASWTVSWAGESAAKLRKLMGLKTVKLSRRPSSAEYYKAKVSGDSVYIKIKAITKARKCGTVYDITVGHEDHTFRTAYMSVSNCSWENTEGVVSYQQSLSEIFPNRLYLWESTARGPGLWQDMWEDARKDSNNQKAIFLGWWAKDSQTLNRNSRAFHQYGLAPPSPEEQKRIDAVQRLYGVTVTQEQLAWYRRKMDPAGVAEEDVKDQREGDDFRNAEQPWTEDEAFIAAGSTFFSPDRLAEIRGNQTSNKYKSFRYYPGNSFPTCRVEPARNWRETQLKVWEEPVDDAFYVISADPAFGHDENNDRSCAEVLRCYADCIEQVAEFSDPLTPTNHFAWILWSLVGWYGGGATGAAKNPVYTIIELNGPGDSVWQNFRDVPVLVKNGYLRIEATEKGLINIFNNVRNYVYTRSDSMAAGGAWHFKTTSPTKVSIMEKLRGYTLDDTLIIRSQDALDEMRQVTRQGDVIKAEGHKKDDKVVTLALGARCWDDRVRKLLISRNLTKRADAARRATSMKDQYQLFQSSMLQDFFKAKSRARLSEAAALRRAGWRGR